MESVVRRLAVVAALGIFAGAAACVACQENGCDAGFEWTASPIGGGTIAPGEYRITFDVEEASYEVVCTIAEGFRQSECTLPDGDHEFDLTFDLTPRQANDTWNPDAPVESLRVSIADHGDWRDDDRSQSVRGPEEVAITVTLGDRKLVDEAFTPDYVRDEDFWGDERCGYCDLRVSTASQWRP